MAYIESSFPPLKVYLREEYMYQQDLSKKGKFHRGVIVSVRCITGQVPLFQVLLENGVLRDKLPSSAFLLEPSIPDIDYEFHELCLWNSFSPNFTVMQIQYLYDTPVDVFMKDRSFAAGKYFATINWASASDQDYTLAESEDSHKSHHIILLDNNQIAIQPNNRIRWHEPDFVTAPFPSNPDYKVNNVYWNAEGYKKWKTSNDDKYFYDVNA
jgi:hypothetical protein